MNIKWENARRGPDWDSTRDVRKQLGAMMNALYPAQTVIELQARVGRMDVIRRSVQAIDVADEATRVYLDKWNRDVSLSFGTVPATAKTIGEGPTTSLSLPEIPVLAVTLIDLRPDLVTTLQSLPVPPNVVVDAGSELDAAWRLEGLIDRQQHAAFGNAICTLLGTKCRPSRILELLLPGFPTPIRPGVTSKLLQPVHGDGCSLSALQTMCAPHLPVP